MASNTPVSQLGRPIDSCRDSAVKTFVVTNTHGETHEVGGNSYELDGCYVSVFKEGTVVASFANWLSIRVKEAI